MSLRCFASAIEEMSQLPSVHNAYTIVSSILSPPRTILLRIQREIYAVSLPWLVSHGSAGAGEYAILRHLQASLCYTEKRSRLHWQHQAETKAEKQSYPTFVCSCISRKSATCASNMEERPKRASRTTRGSDKGLQRLEKKLAEGDYYEAQQLIKMIMNR